MVKAFRDGEKVIGGQRLALSDIVVLQNISVSRRTFIYIDPLDECLAGYRMKVLDSLDQILRRSPNARIFLTGTTYPGVRLRTTLLGGQQLDQ